MGAGPLAWFPCRYSFADLFRSAMGRGWTKEERAGFRSLSQPAKNQKVKELCALTGGRFVWEDRAGPNGVTYTAFGAPRNMVGRSGRRRRVRDVGEGARTSP